jgi:hypothetical protein
MIDANTTLTLAAEDCSPAQFTEIHRFSAFEKRLIRSLIAHGPVLLRGGRGSGKSALLIEADRQMNDGSPNVLSVYVSLRHLPLLRSEGRIYERIFCEILVSSLREKIRMLGFDSIVVRRPMDAGELRSMLTDIASKIGRRIVLMFDDAAHIGRETALTEFFDIFRTISSNLVSCKAAIYPGVTRFGIRFDVFNDATVLDVARDERSPEFELFFHSVLMARFSILAEKLEKSRGSLPSAKMAGLIGRAVVGNMRAFVFACSWLSDRERAGLPDVRDIMMRLASDYYWPLLDEVAPKLGPYQVLIPECRSVAEIIFQHVAVTDGTSVTIHRDYVQKLAKLFEILEYVGFISRREASRSMKSGGRGPRYSLNLATLLEARPQAQLTVRLIDVWLNSTVEPAEFHVLGGHLPLVLPDIDPDVDIAVLDLAVDSLKQGKTYPYGLTPHQISILTNGGFVTIKDVADAEDEELHELPGIGEKILGRIRAVVGQAIWM